jgi:2-polyprenyl-3-methyl-5-hydroxy-6-metoxy-1,4-benzoquinol methylase
MLEHRSQKKELLDATDIPKKDLFLNLKELDFINTWLGGYRISVSGIQKILKSNKISSLVDIGSGGGDTLKHIHSWLKKRNTYISLVGIDLNPVCIDYANANAANEPITFICDDYKRLFDYVPQVDIIHACLFCHHLSEEQLIDLMQFAKQHKTILLINDLERNAVAYTAISWLTKLFSKSYLVKNDAPLSVARGFKMKEWKTIIAKAGITEYSIKNMWAFRHQVIVYGNK